MTVWEVVPINDERFMHLPISAMFVQVCVVIYVCMSVCVGIVYVWALVLQHQRKFLSYLSSSYEEQESISALPWSS